MRAGCLVLVFATTSPALAAPAPWQDTATLDAELSTLAAVAAGLPRSGPIDCAAYARIAPVIASLPAALLELAIAREQLVEPVVVRWRAAHRAELETRIADVVTRLRRDKACPAILDDDAAHLAARLVTALGVPSSAPRVTMDLVPPPSPCANQLARRMALAATSYRAQRTPTTPLDQLAADLADVDTMRWLDLARTTPCEPAFGGHRAPSGADWGDL